MSLLARFLHSLAATACIVGLLVAGVVLGLQLSGGLAPLELALYDWLVRSRPATHEPDPRIVVVHITDEDIQNQGRSVITDRTLATALERLINYEALAIGLDIYRDIDEPPGRHRLNQVLSNNPNIIVVKKIGGGGVRDIPPPPVLQGTDQVGFADLIVDPDGTVRRGLLSMKDGKGVTGGLGLKLAFLYLEHEGVTVGPAPQNRRHMKIGDVVLRPFRSSDGGYVGADDGGYQILLDFHGGQALHRTVSLTELLTGQVDPGFVRDKIVLIGSNAESKPDFEHTPFGLIMPGVELHALVASQLLRAGLNDERPIIATSQMQEFGWTLVWAGLGVGLGFWARSPWRLSLGLLAGLAILAGTMYKAFQGGVWIPSVPPLLAWTLSASILTAVILKKESAERKTLGQLFGRYVSREVAEALWEQRDQFLDGGRPRSQKMTVTVLFSDVQGYTSAAEKLDPDALMRWVNSYMEAMAELVIEHGGGIDDYAGDGVKANFGVPIPRKTKQESDQDAINAVACALSMQETLARLNRQWEAEGLPTVGLRIGIGTGPVVAGSIGSAQRLKYTTVGDTVNVAARLESFEKEALSSQPCRILIDQPTLYCLGDRFHTEEVGSVKVKGKERPITAYRVLSGDEGSANTQPC